MAHGVPATIHSCCQVALTGTCPQTGASSPSSHAHARVHQHRDVKEGRRACRLARLPACKPAVQRNAWASICNVYTRHVGWYTQRLGEYLQRVHTTRGLVYATLGRVSATCTHNTWAGIRNAWASICNVYTQRVGWYTQRVHATRRLVYATPGRISATCTHNSGGLQVQHVRTLGLCAVAVIRACRPAVLADRGPARTPCVLA